MLFAHAYQCTGRITPTPRSIPLLPATDSSVLLRCGHEATEHRDSPASAR
ncbi:hypothetical protein [Rothia aeria]|nr:hypothetical protein [Rothia aeria]